MSKSFYLILLFIISCEAPVPIPSTLTHPPSSTSYIYLPMKKDHKFGDDICYYREYDEKLFYDIYYVRPCEKGKYCQKEVNNGQPFGYCVDLQTNTTTISNLDGSCESDYECQNGLSCENSKCSYTCTNQLLYQLSLTRFTCYNNNYKQLPSNQCEFTELSKDINGFYTGTSDVTYVGKYPGYPNECHKINYISVDRPFYPSTGGTEKDPYYVEESKEWCTKGSVPDNEFVDDAEYCNSGFTLNFYGNKQLKDPSKGGINLPDKMMCVTPIEIDIKNPYIDDGCIITYKIGDQSPKKYRVNSGSSKCSQDIIIKSERYREFYDALNSASDEDKQNCYDIENYKYRCKNVNLIKLWYFKQHPEDYLFYKDRKKLEKVLDYKIQKEYPTYSEFSQYLNYSYLLFLLILTIM